MSPIIPDRLAEVLARPVLSGGHASPTEGMCVMEAVAYVNGDPFSDHPPCASQVLGAFMRSWNDAIANTEQRTALMRPLIPKLVGSASTPEVEQRRADMCLDWLVREHAATWLDLGGETLKPHAAKFRALPPLYSLQAIESAQPVLSAAAQDAAAARAAAWDAARAAALDAAWDAARDAALDAALDAAWAAAWDAARAAARAAAWAAASKNEDAYGAAYRACVPLFESTRATLERSALDLINRMLAVTPASLEK